MRIFISVLLFSIVSLYAEKPRTWVTLKGSNFSAAYAGFKSGKVSLENEQGKVVSFSVKDLSIVDRYYLNMTHEIPLEDLEGGSVHDAEESFKLKSADIKAGQPFQVSGEGYQVKLSSLITPHFVIYYDPSVKVNEMGHMLEKIWFSHALRTPNFINLYGKKRRVYFYLPPGKQLTALGGYFIDMEKSKGKISTRDLNALSLKWSYEFDQKKIKVPAELVKLYNSATTGKIQKIDNEGPYMESLLLSAPFFKWQELYLPGKKLPKNRYTSSNEKLISAQGFLALVFANEIRLNGNDNKTDVGVVRKSLSVKIPPQGKPRGWGKDLITAIKEEKLEAGLDVIYDTSAFKKKKGGKAESLMKTQLLMAIGRFLQKDLEYMIYHCSLSDYIRENSRFPSKQTLSKLYGFSSSSEMDEALLTFIMKENKSL